MKTVLALTTGILAIVFCNCGTSPVNSGNYSPQTEIVKKPGIDLIQGNDSLISVR